MLLLTGRRADWGTVTERWGECGLKVTLTFGARQLNDESAKFLRQCRIVDRKLRSERVS